MYFLIGQFILALKMIVKLFPLFTSHEFIQMDCIRFVFTPVLLICLFLFFIYLKLGLLTQFTYLTHKIFHQAEFWPIFVCIGTCLNP